MTKDKDNQAMVTDRAGDNEVLLEEILRLERRVGLIDGERQGSQRILRYGLTILLAILALFSWTYINSLIDTAVSTRVRERADTVLESVVREMMADEEFLALLSERIDAAAKVVVVDAEQAVNDAEQAINDAEKAVLEAELAAGKADDAVNKAEQAAANAEEASTAAEEASGAVEEIATQAAEETP